jgi:predicted alpha/beta superfamily hydrolase
MHRCLSLARFALALCVAGTLASCGGGGSSSSTVDVTPAPTTPTTPVVTYTYAGSVERDQSITSKLTGITYPFHVYLPPGYAGADTRYPVLVATDGQWIFNSFSRMLDQRRKPMILVSIEQGPGDRRAIDYTLVGGPLYIRFLKEELMPMIEARYRSSGARSFVGTSYGGLLGAQLLAQEPVAAPYFKNYLLFDGAFWALTNASIAEEDARFAASKTLAVHLILTSANAPGNVFDVDRYEARYRARGYAGLMVHRHSFNIAHNDVADPSFDWAIDLVD